MHTQNIGRLREWLHARDYRAALLANPATITWLTGYAPPVQTGPSPFDGGPALAWFQAGELILIVSDAEAAAARETGAEVRDYAGYTVEEPLDCAARQFDVLRQVLHPHESLSGSVVIEPDWMNATQFIAATEALPHAALERAPDDLAHLRAIKTDEEMPKIRAALALCDRAQQLTRHNARPALTELEIWGMIKARLESEIGTRLTVLADLVGGLRTADIGGLPTDYVLKLSDALILDIVPRLNGYWGDNAATLFMGEPPAEMRNVYAVVRAALQHGIEMTRPGVRAGDLDAALREHIRHAGYTPHPHHSGHGFGTTYHEEPRIVPYNNMLLQEGMVIALEPGIYLPGVGGVRLEHALLITADGCEVLTTHIS